MSFSIVLTKQAKTDLVEIYKYIAEKLRSPQAAEGQLARLEKAIASLEQMPERYRVYEHEKWQNRNLRIMTINNYLVFYIPAKEDKTVTVIRVMYGGRNIDRQLNGIY